MTDDHATQPNDDAVAELIATALAEFEAGRSVDLEQLCCEHPAALEQVAAALGLRHDLAALQRNNDRSHGMPTRLAERYVLRDTIGSGAAGTVYRARDERLQRDVAVKLLHRGLLGGGDAAERFHREAVALAAHEHPHIVRIHDQGRSADGTTFLVTELLRGQSLAALLTAAQAAMHAGPSLAAFADLTWLRTELPNAKLEHSWLRQVVRWVAELGEGLVAAHRHGVCHRDVKPGNAFVRDDGTAVLLDFGIAARVGDASITHTHAVLGTPCYMAPEQASGRSDPTPALDIYGLTATLYHLLTLRPPHAGDLQQVLVSLRHEDPVPAVRLLTGLPRDLQAILDRGLEREPRNRYADMAALVHDLRAFLEHRAVAARPLGQLTRTWRRMARRPARSLAIGATAAAVIIGAIAVPAVGALRAQAAERERADRLARLPADICIEGRPDERALVPIDERDRLLEELDQLLELDQRDLGIRLLRAATRLDFGQIAAANADFAAIEEAADSDYVRALAARYAAAANSDGNSAAVNTEGLPEPATDVDLFLAGFHAMRRRDCELADELLSRIEHYVPARDLRLLAILGRQQRDPQRAIEEASWLEGHYGRATARTQHTLAAAKLQLRHYAEAIPHCERALALRPDRHGPWNNLGLAHLRLGHLSEALRCYQRAVELRPWFDNSLSGLCQTQRNLGRIDDARATAERMRDDGWRAYELGNVELFIAFRALTEGDQQLEQAAATRAAAHFERARTAENSRNPKQQAALANRLLAEAIAGNQLDSALVPMLVGMRSDPRNPRLIGNLAAVLRATPIDDEARGRLCLWLFDLAIDLAPNDESLRRRRADLIHTLRSRSHR